MLRCLSMSTRGMWQLSTPVVATALRVGWAGTNRFLSRHLDSDPSSPLRDFWDRTESLSKERSQRKTLASYYLACSSYHPHQVFPWARIWGKTYLDINQTSVMGPWLSTAMPQNKGWPCAELELGGIAQGCPGALPDFGPGGQGSRSRIKPFASILSIFLRDVPLSYKILKFTMLEI